jgi:hypothetical protein
LLLPKLNPKKSGFKKRFSKYSELSHSLHDSRNLDAVEEEDFTDENNKSVDNMNINAIRNSVTEA